MSDLAFRAANARDVPALADLWTEGWHAGHAETAPAALTRLRTRDSFDQRTRAHLDGTFLSLHDGALAGFVMLEGAEIYQFYIAQGLRGSDAATLQMAEAERRLAAAGVCDAWLACGVGNARAARFYEKCAWRNMGLRRESMETSEGPFPLEIIRFEKRLP